MTAAAKRVVILGAASAMAEAAARLWAAQGARIYVVYEWRKGADGKITYEQIN